MALRRDWLRGLNLLLLWAVAKLASIWWHVSLPNEWSDTYYFFQQAQAAQGNVALMTREYPTPAGAFLLVPWLVGGPGDFTTYRSVFVLLVTLADALFVALLIRRAPWGALVWILLETLAGRLVLLRVDPLPALLAGAAVLLILGRRRPASGVVLALGAGLKLWPAILAPLLWSGRHRVRAVLAFVASGVVLVALSLTAGWDRLLSPLLYQADRGLQIEAVAATPPMIWRLGDPSYEVFYSKFLAFEIKGPGVPAMLSAANVAAAVGALLCIVLLVRWFRGGSPDAAVGYLALTEIGVFMATSRALSPQYFLWLAAPMAVVLGFAALRGWGAQARHAAFGVAWVAVMLLLTTLVYPVHYDEILAGQAAPLRLLVARNGLLVAFTLWTAWSAWRFSPRSVPTADAPVAPTTEPLGRAADPVGPTTEPDGQIAQPVGQIAEPVEAPARG